MLRHRCVTQREPRWRSACGFQDRPQPPAFKRNPAPISGSATSGQELPHPSRRIRAGPADVSFLEWEALLSRLGRGTGSEGGRGRASRLDSRCGCPHPDATGAFLRCAGAVRLLEKAPDSNQNGFSSPGNPGLAGHQANGQCFFKQ